VTLHGLATRTLVRFDASLRDDRVRIGRHDADGDARARVLELVDRVRDASRQNCRVLVDSANDFPTASGLASSASAFAALALATVRAAGLDWDAARVSDLARRSSVSAARSVFGGFVELDAGGESAHPVAPREQLPLAVLVCVTTEQAKAIGSTEGMRVSMERSPYAHAWLDEAPRLHAGIREALLARDFERVGALAEASALAMHACAMAAGVVYWNAATLGVLSAVRALRAAGSLAYATIDAGPHVKVLARDADAAHVQAALTEVPGVLRILRAAPGEGARLEAPPHESANGGRSCA
jgi:diphosphomevalonate decarboxylase